jgi:predicted AlkP superfamily pyrophosphatase or phosphodiesterase
MKFRTLAAPLAVLLPLLSVTSARAEIKHPKLIVMMVVDQFRADYLMRFKSRFLPAISDKSGKHLGGYNYLMEQGAYFPYGEYDLLQSMTGPGHATVLTGAYGYQSGIPSNDWYSQENHDWVYCTEDRENPTVGGNIQDPHAGTSPKNLFASTVGDELKNAGYPSRVISISLKDRAAILMGGHRADLAMWMDQNSLSWVSSRFYLPDGKLPPWVLALNAELNARKGKLAQWGPAGPSTGFSAAHAMPLLNEGNAGKFGGDTFPHQAKVGSKASFSMPFGLEITEKAAEAAVSSVELGQGEATDLLAVSFSSHDYAGHAFGPNAREMEEMTVAEDEVISKFLNFLKSKVDLKDVAIVFTGDHGIPMNPEYARANRFPGGRIDEKALAQSLGEKLDQAIGKLPEGQKWIVYAHDFNFHLNHAAIRDKNYDLTRVEEIAKAEILKQPGVAFAVTGVDYQNHRLPPGMHERQTLHTYYPGRSGDLILIPRPGYMLDHEDTVTHLTGYSYDRTVPLIFVGGAFKPGVYATHGAIIDIAPTLSFISGTIPPSMSEGRVLSEILQK